MNKYLQIGIWTTLITAFSLMMYVGYMLFYPFNPVEINSVTLEGDKVAAGNTIYYRLDFCINRESEVIISRRFINGVIYTLETVTVSPEKGCSNDLLPIHVPLELPAGMYKYRVSAFHNINPLRDITVSWETPLFEITEAGEMK